MSEEEKKAIELLENIKDNSWTVKYIMSGDSKNAEVLLNLIEKLQKKNEYYKECLEVVSKHLDNIDYDQILFAIYEYYIPKQKVKDLKQKSEDLIDASQGCMSEEDLLQEHGKIRAYEELLEGRK